MRNASCLTTLDVYTRAVDQQKRATSPKVAEFMLPVDLQKKSAPFRTLPHPRMRRRELADGGK
jgi:hypothetical protein